MVSTSPRIACVPSCPSCNEPLPYLGAAHAPASLCLRRWGWFVPSGVEQTVFSMYAKMPSLYGRSPWSRWYIFNQLFCVVGNGFTWHRGQLVRERDIGRWWEHSWRKPISVMGSWDELRKTRKWERQRGLSITPMSHDAAKVIERSWRRFNHMPDALYPITRGYSALTAIPDDIRPDWLLAAWSMCHMIEMVPAHNEEAQGNVSLEACIQQELRTRFPLPPSLAH